MPKMTIKQAQGRKIKRIMPHTLPSNERKVRTKAKAPRQPVRIRTEEEFLAAVRQHWGKGKPRGRRKAGSSDTPRAIFMREYYATNPDYRRYRKAYNTWRRQQPWFKALHRAYCKKYREQYRKKIRARSRADHAKDPSKRRGYWATYRAKKRASKKKLSDCRDRN